MCDLDKKALEAKEKKATIGPDINLEAFEPASYKQPGPAAGLSAIPDDDKKRMILTGVDLSEAGRSGTYLQKNATVLHSLSKQEGLEVMPIKDALKHYDWLGDYYWKLVAVDTDKYTAAAQLGLQNGYVIRALPGSKVVYPVQACMYLDQDGSSQNVHNLVIAEEGSELHIITGCATAAHVRRYFRILCQKEC